MEEDLKEKPIIEEDKKQSEQWKLLEQLRALRDERYQLQRRQNSYNLLRNLSGGIQEMLGLEKAAFSREDEFCCQLTCTVQNWNLQDKIDRWKILPEVELFSPEIENADVQTLKSLILQEKKKKVVPAIDWPWDTLMDKLLPCLEKLMDSARNLREKDCRDQLDEICNCLKTYSIYPIWYHDEVIQMHPGLKLNYVPRQGNSIPALFLYTDDEYVCIGECGYAAVTEEIEQKRGR